MLGNSARLELPVEANDQPLGDPIVGMKEARQRGGRQSSWGADAGPSEMGESWTLSNVSCL